MSRKPVSILRGDLQAHPAVAAWSRLRPARVTPDAIQVLREKPKTSVYRLEGVAPGSPAGDRAVIAKRCVSAKASSELTVYEHILPHLPVTAPRYYGAHADEGQTCWLFLEDVGDMRYVESDGTHLGVTARWLALFHTSAARLGAARGLPDGGPGRYLAHLSPGREKIRQRLASPALLTGPEVAMQQSIVALQDALEARWSWIERSCTGLPATLVHGDYRPKNVHLQAGGAGLVCYPTDWETAGWGVPAADLWRIDLQAYSSGVRECWDVSPETLERLARIGQIFRALAAIDWESSTLRFDSRPAMNGVMCSLAVLGARLADAVRTAGVPA